MFGCYDDIGSGQKKGEGIDTAMNKLLLKKETRVRSDEIFALRVQQEAKTLI